MTRIAPAIALMFFSICAMAAVDAKAVKIQDINRKTSNFVNKSVVVHGEIETMLSANAFILDGDGVMNDEVVVIRSLPVVNRSNPNSAVIKSPSDIILLEEDNEVQVTGTVRRLSLSDIRADYGITLDPKVVNDLDGTFPVIVAAAPNITVTEKN